MPALTTAQPIREPDYVLLPHAPGAAAQVTRARGQNFIVEWISAPAGGEYEAIGGEEAMLVLPDVAATVSTAAESARAPARSVAILPAGRWKIRLEEAGIAIVLRTDFSPEEGRACLNGATYDAPDPRVGPVAALKARDGAGLRIHPLDAVAPASGRSRLKMLQSATMSINWVEYEGPRDRRQLSPHSHEDFEQGSLAIHGHYINHFRVEWGPDADMWRQDAHPAVAPNSLTIIPPGVIHTTEGVGEGRHLLLDIFAPARLDFRAKGWIANAADYADP